MTPDRWTLALQSGELDWPEEGRSLILRARPDADFSALGTVEAVQGFYPDHARLLARGIDVVDEAEGPYGAALVQIVKSKAETLSLIAEACGQVPPGGLIAVDGQKDEGIESVLKAVRREMGVDGTLSKSHGKLFWFTRPDAIPETLLGWLTEPSETEEGFLTAPGMFSPDGPDAGSELLSALVPQIKGRVADLGAGWGYLPAVLLPEQPDIESYDLIEAERAALELAQVNVPDPRARFFWDDATAFSPDAPYDVILTNPPFHAGKAGDPALGQAFIRAAAQALKPSGRLYLVANRHLPYEPTLKEQFGTGKMLAEIGGYKLYEAAKPKRPGTAKRR